MRRCKQEVSSIKYWYIWNCNLEVPGVVSNTCANSSKKSLAKYQVHVRMNVIPAHSTGDASEDQLLRARPKKPSCIWNLGSPKLNQSPVTRVSGAYIESIRRNAEEAMEMMVDLVNSRHWWRDFNVTYGDIISSQCESLGSRGHVDITSNLRGVPLMGSDWKFPYALPFLIWPCQSKSCKTNPQRPDGAFLEMVGNMTSSFWTVSPAWSPKRSWRPTFRPQTLASQCRSCCSLEQRFFFA